MANGSRVCPQCGGLNGVDEKVCFRCGKRLQGPTTRSALGFLTDFSADGIPATKLMVGICILVYGLCIADSGGKVTIGLTGAFSLSTLLRFGLLFGDLAYNEPWRVLSAVFVHLGLLHIGMNMLSLVTLGRTMEPHFGSARFLILYVLAGILGFVASQWWYGAQSYTAGASGSIFGLVGAFVGVLFARRSPGWTRALVNNLVYAGIISFVLPANTAAHLGGFFGGMLIGFAFEKEPQPQRREGLMRAVAGVCLLACLASVALSATSPVWKSVRQHEQAQPEPSQDE